MLPDVITIRASGAAIWSVGDRPAMGPPKNQKGVRVWTGTRLIELESHELIKSGERTSSDQRQPGLTPNVWSPNAGPTSRWWTSIFVAASGSYELIDRLSDQGIRVVVLTGSADLALPKARLPLSCGSPLEQMCCSRTCARERPPWAQRVTRSSQYFAVIAGQISGEFQFCSSRRPVRTRDRPYRQFHAE